MHIQERKKKKLEKQKKGLLEIIYKPGVSVRMFVSHHLGHREVQGVVREGGT